MANKFAEGVEIARLQRKYETLNKAWYEVSAFIKYSGAILSPSTETLVKELCKQQNIFWPEERLAVQALLRDMVQAIQNGPNFNKEEKSIPFKESVPETVDWPACIDYINKYVKENFSSKTVYAMMLEIYDSEFVKKLDATDSTWLVDVHIATAIRHQISQHRNEVLAFLSNPNKPKDF